MLLPKWARNGFVLAVVLLSITLVAHIAEAAETAETKRLQAPSAIQGVIDASNYDFENQGNLSLDGEWEIYWSELLEPGDTQRYQPNYYPVPKPWTGESFDQAGRSNYGYATYRLAIRIGSNFTDARMGIYMPSVATSYKLWVDGRLLAENGIVGKNAEEMVPKNYRKTVYFEPKGSEVEVIVQVANFVQRKGGLWEPIRFGTAEQIVAEREKNVVFQMFIMSSLIAMGVYHLAFYFFRLKNKALLAFGLVCMTIALRTAVLGETILVRFFPDLSWEFVVKIEYWTSALGAGLFLLFGYYQYPKEINRKLTWTAFVLIVLYGLAVTFTEAKIYTYWMPYFSLFVGALFVYLISRFLLAIYHGREGSKLHAIALVVLFASIVNDVLYYTHFIHTGEMVSIGLLFYLFVQAIILASNFASAFVQTEHLSAKLQELNTSLEIKVEERTSQLAEANDRLSNANQELIQMEASRRSLISNISHELRTPLTSIQGYVKALKDGTIKEHSDRYLDLVYRKAQMLEHIFKDLLLLSRLEARKLEFYLESMPAVELIRNLFEMYAWDVMKDGHEVLLEYDEETMKERDLTVLADPVRLEQVFANLILNAKKYTPTGGSIHVKADILLGEDRLEYLRVSITDTGSGISEDELEHVFVPYYRGEGARKSKRSGTGLGLAIAKEIIDVHHGRIGVDSRKEEGSTFYFMLPVAIRGDAK